MKNAGTNYDMKSPTRLVNLDKLKAEIADSITLSEVVQNVLEVELFSSGTQQKGLCPLHEEDTPSFYVNDAKGMYHCFGCKAGGDSIDLVRRAQNLGFREALIVLAEAAGVDISKYERPLTEEEQAAEKTRKTAEQWLSDNDLDDSGRISRETAAAFGVIKSNTVPPIPELKKKDYLFRGTVFPYRTPNGRLAGWKTRHSDGKQFGVPRETSFYEPTLFGIQIARQHTQDGTIYVVEGEYDAMALYESGQTNVVAIGGSNFVDAHIEMLEDLRIRRVVFVFDGDTGGREGAISVAKRYWNRKGIQVLIKALPEGADPDDLVQNGVGIGPFEAVAAIEYLLKSEWETDYGDGLADKMDFLEHVRSEYGSKMDQANEALIQVAMAGWLDLPELDILEISRADGEPLQAPESEKAVLGEAIRKQGYYIELRKRFSADTFFVLKHRRIWRKLEAMLLDNLDFDLATVQAAVMTDGVQPEYVASLVESGQTNLPYHEDRVLDLATRRHAQQHAEKFVELIADPETDSDQLIGSLTAEMSRRALGQEAFSSIQDQVDEAMDVLHERMRNPSSIHGLDIGTQFPNFSKATQGMQPKRLWLLAAASGEGKSTLALQWCASLAIHQAVPTDFISLEMDEPEILFKMAAHLTGIDGLKITGGDLDEMQAKQVEKAMARIRKSPLRIHAPDGITPNEFVLYCRESKMERRTEVFVLDYVQLVSPDAGMERASGYELYGHFGRQAKMKVSRAMDCCVLAIGQLNRESKMVDVPTKENMGDSYDLVRHADVIALLSGEEESEMCDLRIDKNRQGPGNINLPVHFNRPHQTLREANGGTQVPEYRVT